MNVALISYNVVIACFHYSHFFEFQRLCVNFTAILADLFIVRPDDFIKVGTSA